MSLSGRGRSGWNSGESRYTATPPTARTVTPCTRAASITRRASATGSASGAAPSTAGSGGAVVKTSSSGEQEVKITSVLRDVHDCPAQEISGVVAARVQAHRPTDLLDRPGLVDVPVQPDHRLVLLDRVAHRLAAD